MSKKPITNGAMATSSEKEFDMDSNDFNADVYLEKILKVINQSINQSKCAKILRNYYKVLLFFSHLLE